MATGVKQRLLDELESEESVAFAYGRVDGSLRVADGTKMIGEFSEEWDNTRDVYTYYDNTVGDYRCFKQATSVMLFTDFKNIERL